MKKFTLIVISICVLLMIAADFPPALPSSFWGYTSLPVGTTITATIDGQVTTTRVFAYGSQRVYAIDVAGEHAEGAVIVFRARWFVVGVGRYHTGTNVRLDLGYYKR